MDWTRLVSNFLKSIAKHVPICRAFGDRAMGYTLLAHGQTSVIYEYAACMYVRSTLHILLQDLARPCVSLQPKLIGNRIVRNGSGWQDGRRVARKRVCELCVNGNGCWFGTLQQTNVCRSGNEIQHHDICHDESDLRRRHPEMVQEQKETLDLDRGVRGRPRQAGRRARDQDLGDDWCTNNYQEGKRNRTEPAEPNRTEPDRATTRSKGDDWRIKRYGSTWVAPLLV